MGGKHTIIIIRTKNYNQTEIDFILEIAPTLFYINVIVRKHEKYIFIIIPQFVKIEEIIPHFPSELQIYQNIHRIFTDPEKSDNNILTWINFCR